MGSSQSGRHPAFWPLVITGLLLLGIVGTFWILWKEEAARTGLSRPNAEQYDRLIQRCEELRQLLALTPCEAAQKMRKPEPGQHQSSVPGLSVPGLSVPEKQPPARENAPAASEAPAKAPDSTTKPVSASALADRLERACVFVVSSGGANSIATGSGFFVAPDYIVTNRHVVSKSNGKAIVTSKNLGRAYPAAVIATSRGKNTDYALLKVALPAGVKPEQLNLAKNVAKTEKVGAWGFPDLVGRADPGYARLLRGEDFRASPELSYSEGVVSAVLDHDPAIIVHTAPISPGNSGGPLVNANGEVVGINTMITLDESSYRQASLALAAEDLARFLASHGIKK